MFPGIAAPRSRARLAVAVVAPALLLAACGSNSGYGTPTGSSGGSTAGAAKVETQSGAVGTYLTDGAGRALYLFTSDSGSTSSCTGTCASVWSPLTTHGTTGAARDARSGMLGTITRSDGSKQVTYAGHPLYYYAGDSAPGDTNGEGSDEFGARWWLVSPTGASITEGGGSTGSSGSNGGGY